MPGHHLVYCPCNWAFAEQTGTSRVVGGFGLVLGTEGLSLLNVTRTTAWKGLIDRMVLFACAPADTGPGNKSTSGDGLRLCGELALWTGAEVIAARDTQYYNPSEIVHYRRGRTVKNTIDFGAWEGPVYRFDPHSGQPTQIMPHAYEMENPAAM